MSQVEPMTAAEARKLVVWPYGTSERILAAIEERERLLGEAAVLRDERDRAKHEAAEVRRLCEADASLGALVRRIREHPARKSDPMVTVRAGGETTNSYLDELGLTSVLAILDSLLPKEPEVVTGASGREYRVTSGKAIEARHICADGTPTYWATVGGVPVIDAPVVAALMAKGGKDG